MNSPVINETWQLTRNTLELIRDSRTPTQVDRDRLVYATSVARLAEVTQVISADHGYVFHNRLTHSLKVAQLSRRIAEHLLREQVGQVAEAGGLDPDAAEAAGLAHDLGHPPFGHIAEDELDLAVKQLDSADGYEGNAQSFRLVAKLMVGDAIDRYSIPLHPGLNLTRTTLNGILKYPWMINENPSKKNKWGSYKTERDLFNWVRQDYDTAFGVRTKSLEAEVMDWADDITYAVHDVVDFYCAGRIPLEQLGRKNSVELKSFLDEVFERQGNESLKANRQQLEDSFQYIVDFVFSSIDSRYTGTIDQRKTLWQLMTLLIGKYVTALKIKKSSQKLVEIELDAKNQIDMLKQLTWHYVILNADLSVVQHGQRNIVRTVFNTFYNVTANQPEIKLLPPFYEELLKIHPEEKIRLVADCVSSMTEAEVCNVFNKLAGYKVSPML